MIEAKTRRLRSTAKARGAGNGREARSRFAHDAQASIDQTIHLHGALCRARRARRLGINIWRAAPEPLEVADTVSERQSTLWTSLLRALFVQLSNAKTAIFYASMLAALLPAPTILDVVCSAADALPDRVRLVHGRRCRVLVPTPRAVYLRSKVWIDRTAGAVAGALGVKLMVDSLRRSA
ncbi:LysE family transporter [uncultured Bosea sp.]|uniref:LysE family transporter n=1 Tax=uncultured Bosea sp. TaxID=211457 RepID=UPI0025EC9F60|nr:LysE family transporter [uncultured Bosea sp.]